MRISLSYCCLNSARGRRFLPPRSRWPVERVAVALKQSVSTEWDDDGHVTGYGLTLRETARIRSRRPTRLYVVCLRRIVLPGPDRPDGQCGLALCGHRRARVSHRYADRDTGCCADARGHVGVIVPFTPLDGTAGLAPEPIRQRSNATKRQAVPCASRGGQSASARQRPLRPMPSWHRMRTYVFKS